MEYDLQKFVVSNVKVIVTSNGTVININVDSATRQFKAILNKTVQETDWNLMTMDIGKEIFEENVE